MGDQGHIPLVAALPVAAVDEYQQRRMRLRGRKQIKPLQGIFAIGQIFDHTELLACAQRALLPLPHDFHGIGVAQAQVVIALVGLQRLIGGNVARKVAGGC